MEGVNDYYIQHFRRETNFYHGGHSLGIELDARHEPAEQDTFTDPCYQPASSERMMVTQRPGRRLDEKADNSSITERLVFVQLLGGMEDPENTRSFFKEIE